MKKYLSNTFSKIAKVGLACIATAVGAESRTPENSFGIIPMPLSVKEKKESPFEITHDTTIVYQGEESRVCAEYLQDRIAKATNMKLKINTTSESNAIILKVSPKEIEFTEKDAYYFASGKDKISITGKSASGLFYGVQTLFQLLPAGIYSTTQVKDMKLSVASLEIKDKPMMGKIRGLHVDIARHFRTKDEMLKIIDCMVMHKLNYLHIHLTDDQGWGFELKCYPELTRSCKHWTQTELKEICAYAKKHYVSIIPEIDMPGHMASVIKALPEMKSPKELRSPGKVIRIDSKGSEFAKKVLSEVNSLFDSEYIHIGCDEINYGCPKIIYTNAEINQFVKEICSFIKKDLNKTPIVWDDAFVKGYHDKDTVVQWWRYGKVHWWQNLKYTVDEEINLRQQPFIFSPAYWLYFDMGNISGGWAKAISTADVYNWDPYGDMIGATEESRKLALGAIACTWSERIVTMKDFGSRTFPRLAAYSERIWRGGKSDNKSILSWTDYRDNVLIPYQLDRYDALKCFYWSKNSPTLLKELKDTRKKIQ